MPAVRFQIAQRLNALVLTAPEFMWQRIENFAQHEQSRGVLSALVTGPLDRLAWSQSDRVASMLEIIFDRAGNGEGAIELRERAVTILLDLYLQRSHPACKAKVYSGLDDVGAFHAELHSMMFRLRGYLTYGPVDPREPEAEAIRQRALGFMATVVTNTIAGFGQTGGTALRASV